jgi:endoribonuclease symE
MMSTFSASKKTTEKSAASSADRIHTLKVYETSGFNSKTVPQIRLQGVWLEQCGFEPGMPIRVECENGKLTIVPES